MRSSYRANRYGPLFAALVRTHRPRNVVEFGCLEGYSTHHILRALEANGGSFEFRVFDLFEDYPFRHAEYAKLVRLFPEVRFTRADYYGSAGLFEDGSIDLLHIDVSNTADTFRTFVSDYFRKLKNGGIAILEGGSAERDEVAWMVAYGKPRIAPFLAGLRGRHEFVVIEAFPSVTLFRRVEPAATGREIDPEHSR